MDRTLIWQLAFRYLRGKRSANAVPILSRISMVAIAVSSAAMIILFSVFNGLESTIKEMYKAFYPDLKVSIARGKFFRVDDAKIAAARQVSGVLNVTASIEDNVMAFTNNNKEQKVLTLKGIDKNYFKVNDVLDYIAEGDDSVSMGHPYTAIAGVRIVNELGANIHYWDSFLDLYYINPLTTDPGTDLSEAYQSLKLHPAGVFHIQDDFDSKYILAPLPLVQELFKQQGRYSSIEISTEPGNAGKIKKQVQEIFGNDFRVESRYEQNKTMYMVMGGEKWAIYVILVMVLLIASFNMVGALSMLVLEKQKDIAILKAMGAVPGTIRKIFLLEGVLWAMTGGLIGIFIGTAVAFAQQQFGFIKFGGSSFLMDAYPVKIQAFDLLLVTVTIMLVGVLVSWYPAIRATRAIDPSLKSA